MTSQMTEGKFSDWCKRNNLYRLKLQVNISNIMIGHATATPADYLVLDSKNTYFVEVKEVLKDDKFPNSRFKQQFKLTKLQQQFPNSHIRCFILINFIAQNVVCLIPVLEYNTLLSGDSSLYLCDIPKKYQFSWRSLKF